MLFSETGCGQQCNTFPRLAWRASRVAFLILVAVLILVHVFLSEQSRLKKILRRRLRDPHTEGRCADVTKEMRSGKWRLRRDILPRDFQHRMDEDIRMRELLGLPITLHRDDLRCGNMFPLDSHDFRFKVSALCDPHSSAPCCNHKSGWCGSGQENCSCNNCTDYRNTVAAELNEFVSSSGCQFKNFTSKQACQLLSERVSSLSLIGDSLVRQFHSAMLILLTDDKETGCLRKKLNESVKQSCSGNMQFVDSPRSICHSHTVRKLSQLPNGKFCEGRHNFSYAFLAFYKLHYANSALNEVRAHLHKNNSVVAIGVGLHMGLNTSQVLNGYLKPIIQLKEREKSYWPLIVWLPIHAPGSLKPIRFLSSQNHEAVRHFNMAMREYLEPIGVPIFDTFNLTLGVHSYDGTHFGFGVNMVKAQLFLNFLDETFSIH